MVDIPQSQERDDKGGAEAGCQLGPPVHLHNVADHNVLPSMTASDHDADVDGNKLRSAWYAWPNLPV